MEYVSSLRRGESLRPGRSRTSSVSIFFSEGSESACGKVTVTTRNGFSDSLPLEGTIACGADIIVVRVRVTPAEVN